jgi:hypothetical protein
METTTQVIKSIADLKRMLVVGSRWHLVNSQGWCPGVRECGRVQSNSFAFVTLKKRAAGWPEHTSELSWCDWPKKADVIFGDRTFTIVRYVDTGEYRRRLHDLTYTREDKYLEDLIAEDTSNDIRASQHEMCVARIQHLDKEIHNG